MLSLGNSPHIVRTTSIPWSAPALAFTGLLNVRHSRFTNETRGYSRVLTRYSRPRSVRGRVEEDRRGDEVRLRTRVPPEQAEVMGHVESPAAADRGRSSLSRSVTAALF